jgi:hypothetical protein
VHFEVNNHGLVIDGSISLVTFHGFPPVIESIHMTIPHIYSREFLILSFCFPFSRTCCDPLLWDALGIQRWEGCLPPSLVVSSTSRMKAFVQEWPETLHELWALGFRV